MTKHDQTQTNHDQTRPNTIGQQRETTTFNHPLTGFTHWALLADGLGTQRADAVLARSFERFARLSTARRPPPAAARGGGFVAFGGFAGFFFVAFLVVPGPLFVALVAVKISKIEKRLVLIILVLVFNHTIKI